MEATPNYHTELINKLRQLERKFRFCCRQIMLLGHRINEVETRFIRAYSTAYRYSLMLQLTTLEGMKKVYNEYGYTLADQLEALQDEMVAEGLMSDSEEEFTF